MILYLIYLYQCFYFLRNLLVSRLVRQPSTSDKDSESNPNASEELRHLSIFLLVSSFASRALLTAFQGRPIFSSG